jgi:putative flippase GtrA
VFRLLAGSKLPRFIVVGLISTCLYFCLCYALREFWDLSVFSASLIAYLICFCFSYFGQRRFAFQFTGGHGVSLPRYALLQACLGLMVSLVTEWLTSILGLAPLHRALLAAGLAGICSFFVSASWVFRNQ